MVLSPSKSVKQALRKNRKRDLMPRDRQATTNCTAPSMVNNIPNISATKPIEIFSLVRKIKPAPISIREWIKIRTIPRKL